MNLQQLKQINPGNKQVFNELNNLSVVSAKPRQKKTFEYNGKQIEKDEQWVLLKDDLGETIPATFVGHKDIMQGMKIDALKSTTGSHGLRGIEYQCWNDKNSGEKKEKLQITASAQIKSGQISNSPQVNAPVARSTGQAYTLEEIAELNNFFLKKADCKDVIAQAIIASKASACAIVQGLKVPATEKLKEAVNNTFPEAPDFDSGEEIPF